MIKAKVTFQRTEVREAVVEVEANDLELIHQKALGMVGDIDFTSRKVIDVQSAYTDVEVIEETEELETKYERWITCPNPDCENLEEMDGDLARHKANLFEHVENLDDDDLGINNEAAYKCKECGTLCVSETKDRPIES